MKTIEIQPITAMPSDQDFRLLPDFLIHCLIKLGIGRIEADRNLSHDGKIDFIFTPSNTQVVDAAILHTNRDGRYPSDHFPVTARLRFMDDRTP
jgi:endonuclease/exonuclease/phosphatase family metal-dependent hydrolase